VSDNIFIKVVLYKLVLYKHKKVYNIELFFVADEIKKIFDHHIEIYLTKKTK
jgi:hypothetical protein